MTTLTPLSPTLYVDVVRRALAEDVGSGDITTLATVPADLRARGVLVVKEDCVLAGLDVAFDAFRQAAEKGSSPLRGSTTRRLGVPRRRQRSPRSRVPRDRC